MPVNVGQISVSLTANTASFTAEMNRAEQQAAKSGATIRTTLGKLTGSTAGLTGSAQRVTKAFDEIGGHAVPQMSAASAAIRTLEGNFQNNIRAAERFIGTTLGLAPLLQKAFPVVGGIALLGVLSDLGSKAYELFKEFRDAPDKLAGGIRALNDPLQQSNDELTVTNDKLANAIAVLQGKHENTIKLALDEARLAADKLAASLDHAQGEMAKFLDENKVSVFQQLLGRAGDADIRKTLVGDSGLGGYRGQIADITEAGNEKIRAATTKQAADAARTERDTALQKKYAEALAYVNQELTQREALQSSSNAAHISAAIASPYGPISSSGAAVAGTGADQALNIEKLRAVRRQLQLEADSIPSIENNADLEGQRAGLEATARPDPYRNRIRELLAEARSSEQSSESAGGSESEKAYAKAAGETEKVIATLNDELAKHHQALTLVQTLYIRSIENTIALNAAEAEWKNKLGETEASLAERTKGQELLNAAIGKGAAAMREASIQTQLLQALGERANDPGFLKSHAGDVEGLRSRIAGSYDAQRAEQSAKNVDKLNTEIEATQRLTAAQREGAEAVRQAALEAKIADAQTQGATPPEIAAMRHKEAADRANQSAENLANLTQEIEATKRLTAAQLEGLDAVRQAELANRLSQMQREGATPAELDAARQASQAQYGSEIAGEAGRRLNGASDQIQSLQRQLAVLQQIRATRGDSLQVENAIKGVTQELTALQNEQLLISGTARDGLRAFYREMVQEGASAAAQVHEVLTSAFTGVNDNLAKLMSGQKANWAGFFKGLSEQTAKLALSNGERGIAGKLGGLFGQKDANGQSQPWDEKGPGGIVGKIGGLFGFGGVGVKRDGSSAASALFVQMAGSGSEGGGGLLGNIFRKKGSGSGDTGDAGGSDGGSILSGFLKDGGFGSGGDSGGDSGGGNFLGSLLGGGGSGDSGGDGGGGGIGGLFKNLFGGGGDGDTASLPFGGFFASGGDVDPGHAYMVGEKGPELWTPPSKGTIVPNHKLGGSNHYYTIDARGTDPVLTEQRTRAAIIASHKSSVQTSARVSDERVKRTPQK